MKPFGSGWESSDISMPFPIVAPNQMLLLFLVPDLALWLRAVLFFKGVVAVVTLTFTSPLVRKYGEITRKVTDAL